MTNKDIFHVDTVNFGDFVSKPFNYQGTLSMFRCHPSNFEGELLSMSLQHLLPYNVNFEKYIRCLMPSLMHRMVMSFDY